VLRVMRAAGSLAIVVAGLALVGAGVLVIRAAARLDPG
jgi:hypothetical protein